MSLIPAIIALVGVLFGVLVTAGSNYLLATRRERVEHEREARNLAIEIKRAARLIDADLSCAQNMAEFCVQKREWWSDDVAPLTVDGWQHYRDTLAIAPELSDDDWLGMLAAVEAVDHLNAAKSIAVELGGVHIPIPDGTAAPLDRFLNRIKAGRAILRDLYRAK